jgi:hypothetical protein
VDKKVLVRNDGARPTILLHRFASDHFPRFSLLFPFRLNKFTTTLLRDITELPEWKYYGIGDTLSSTTLLYEKCHRYQSDFSCSRL